MWLLKNIFCTCKMFLISTKGYENAGVDMLIMKKRVKSGQV